MDLVWWTIPYPYECEYFGKHFLNPMDQTGKLILKANDHYAILSFAFIISLLVMHLFAIKLVVLNAIIDELIMHLLN